MAALAGCQTGPNIGETKDDPDGTQDIAEALAQLPEASVLQYSADGIPQFVVGDLGRAGSEQEAGLTQSDAGLRAALPPLLKAFRLQNKDLVLRQITVDDLGSRHYRYDQKFNGLDVIGADVAFHVDIKGEIYGANGTAHGGIPQSLGATSISDSAANLAVANDARYAGLTGRTVSGSRLVYLQADDGSLHKAFELIVEGKNGLDPIKDKVYVDVESGALVAVHPTIHHALNRVVYNLNHGTSGGTLARSEGQAATSDLDVNGAYDGTGATYMLYKNFFNRDSYDNAGAQLHSDVHYSSNYCNAFWDGSRMAYGDGNSSQNCGPLARSVDVTGHELTHAVTERTSNLTYSGESGGLNESMSDIFGNSTEAWVAGGSTGTNLAVSNNTFLVGETVLPPYLRNMCDPAADGSSADYWTTSTKNLDPHYSSGPNNLVFCLLVKGGTHPRGKSTVQVPAIGIDKTIRLFYNSNAHILTSSATYASIRSAMETSATQLGYDQATKDAAGCAYAAIGVGTAPTTCGGSPPPPPPGDVVLSNGVPVSNLADSTVGNMKFYKLTVPSGQTTLTFTISGGSGDADMYVKSGAHPTETVYDCRPYISGNSETCTFTPPTAGDYYVGLRAYSAYSGVTLTGTYSASTGGDPYLTNAVPVSNLSGATSSTAYWRIAVPAGKTVTTKISGGSGDADLYTRFGARPTTSSYACRPYLYGNAETCTNSSSTAGDWYIMLRGYSAYSGVTLISSF